VDVNEADAVDLILKPGEMSLHHIWIVHGSNANLSQTPRIGIAIRYLSTRVKQDSPGKPFAMLVRGKDEFNHFQHMEPPTRNDATAGEGVHKEAMERIRASIMQGAAKKA
jgi:non-heme Fe2+,alpha-ketoglutarate-dependent halogenase